MKFTICKIQIIKNELDNRILFSIKNHLGKKGVRKSHSKF